MSTPADVITRAVDLAIRGRLTRVAEGAKLLAEAGAAASLLPRLRLECAMAGAALQP